jgi:hypothetical protein
VANRLDLYPASLNKAGDIFLTLERRKNPIEPQLYDSFSRAGRGNFAASLE